MLWKIVVVEDEEDLMKDLCALFDNEKGFKAIGFAEADKALEYVSENDVDLVMMDIVMPIPKDWSETDEEIDFGKKTGIFLAKKIKKIKPKVKCAAFTVVRDPLINAEMRKAGIEIIKYKPAPFQELLEAAQRLLK